MTYYFGDFNLPRDKFLLEKVKSNEDGWIEIDVMLKFQRYANILVVVQGLSHAFERGHRRTLSNKTTVTEFRF